MEKIKKPLVFTLIILPIAVVGSYFAVLMSFSNMTLAAVEDAVRQVGSIQLLSVLSTIQPAILTLLCAFFGYILSEKIGLMRTLKLDAKKLCIALIISAFCGAVMSLDVWTFGKIVPEVGEYYNGAGSFDLTTWVASVLYGGVIEEVMMRLFFMSLLSFLGWKLFYKKSNSVPTKVLIFANVIAALLFAAGHLPSTALFFDGLTPMIVLRCFLLNGAAGLLFGWLYRKYGIQYAMLSHMIFHIVSRTIWLVAL